MSSQYKEGTVLFSKDTIALLHYIPIPRFLDSEHEPEHFVRKIKERYPGLEKLEVWMFDVSKYTSSALVSLLKKGSTKLKEVTFYFPQHTYDTERTEHFIEELSKAAIANPSLARFEFVEQSNIAIVLPRALSSAPKWGRREIHLDASLLLGLVQEELEELASLMASSKVIWLLRLAFTNCGSLSDCIRRLTHPPHFSWTIQVLSIQNCFTVLDHGASVALRGFIISCCSELKELWINRTIFNDASLPLIAESLVHCKKLANVDFSHSFFHSNMASFGRFFEETKSLNYLKFYRATFSMERDAFPSLLQALHENKSLHYLDLRKCMGLNNDTTGVAIRDLLLNHPVLESMWLERVPSLGDAGMEKIADGVARGPGTLQYLLLADCGANDSGVYSLLDAVANNANRLEPTRATAKQLMIPKNVIGVQGAGALAQYLLHPRCGLQRLHLVSCSMSDEALKLLIAGLEGNQSLQRLNLNRNHDVTPIGWQALAHVLPKLKYLKHLAVNKKGSKCEGFRREDVELTRNAFLEGLSKNQSLQCAHIQFFVDRDADIILCGSLLVKGPEESYQRKISFYLERNKFLSIVPDNQQDKNVLGLWPFLLAAMQGRRGSCTTTTTTTTDTTREEHLGMSLTYHVLTCHPDAFFSKQ